MKEVKILVIIIIILAIIFGIKISGVFENKEELTLEQVKEIIAKSENIKNYTYKNNYNGEEILRKYNNNKEYFEMNGNKYYTDYEKNEAIAIVKDSKKVLIMNTILKEEMKSLKESFYLTAENAEEYNYIGEEIYKGKNCIVIELNRKYEEIEGLDWYFNKSEKEIINEKYKNQMIKNQIWIAKDEGVILKVVSKLGDEESVQEFEFEFNCVSDEEVQAPDLSGYEIIDTRK